MAKDKPMGLEMNPKKDEKLDEAQEPYFTEEDFVLNGIMNPETRRAIEDCFHRRGLKRSDWYYEK